LNDNKPQIKFNLGNVDVKDDNGNDVYLFLRTEDWQVNYTIRKNEQEKTLTIVPEIPLIDLFQDMTMYTPKLGDLCKINFGEIFMDAIVDAIARNVEDSDVVKKYTNDFAFNYDVEFTEMSEQFPDLGFFQSPALLKQFNTFCEIHQRNLKMKRDAELRKIIEDEGVEGVTDKIKDGSIIELLNNNLDDSRAEDKIQAPEIKPVKIKPNDPCPCGKKRLNMLPMKYKNCCGRGA